MFQPKSYKVALKQQVWRKAMEKEIKLIKKNELWDIVDNFPE